MVFCSGVLGKDFVDSWQNGVGHEKNKDFSETAVLNARTGVDYISFDADAHEWRSPINGEDDNDSISEEDKHDLAWELYNEHIYEEEFHNPTALLELYGCTIYSDEFGIERTDSDSAVSTATAMSTAAYSRIPILRSSNGHTARPRPNQTTRTQNLLQSLPETHY